MAAKKGKTTKKAGTKGKKAQNSYSFRDEIIISWKCSFCIFVRNLWTAGLYHAGFTFFRDCFRIFKQR